jgi:ferrochelatase
VVASGDPYQWQCERTADAIAARLGEAASDRVTCYQSRVGPLAWIGPSTESEIHRAGADGVPVVVAPIAFVSEHSETLVEIEVEYRELARRCGVPGFVRVPAVGAATAFIAGLAGLVEGAAGGGRPAIASAGGGRLCPREWSGCPMGATHVQGLG